jgi:hypothetical protein
MVRSLIVIMLSATLVVAQSYRGTIRGAVTDPSGAVIPGATVTARNVETGLERTTTTEADGGYVVPELPAGKYEVTVEAAGFSKVTHTTAVNVGTESRDDFGLPVSGGSIDVDVILQTPVVTPDRATLGDVVTSEQIAQLPLNGRDFTKLVPLVAGATVEPSGVAGTEKGFGQFNINGNRDRSNNYTLDGTDNNDPFFNNSALNQVGITGAPASLLPVDAIAEFNLQSQFGAE